MRNNNYYRENIKKRVREGNFFVPLKHWTTTTRGKKTRAHREMHTWKIVERDYRFFSFRDLCLWRRAGVLSLLVQMELCVCDIIYERLHYIIHYMQWMAFRESSALKSYQSFLEYIGRQGWMLAQNWRTWQSKNGKALLSKGGFR